ncbi:hypothetical protein E3N88_34475 [Mikania micrantha]|uniref:Uncharacterized protein n=1 Tax=Mikania micrantha TaxID=192012 RepID=A0A5N6LY85_9ASTR|nr:hypothetical protein E3N88_34475 [Mikania micrantha]
MSNDLRSWFVTFPNGMISLVEIGAVLQSEGKVSEREVSAPSARSRTDASTHTSGRRVSPPPPSLNLRPLASKGEIGEKGENDCEFDK